MAKTISNKKYEEFWNNDNLDIKSDEKTENKSSINENDVKKQVRKEVKKEVKKLEEQVKELNQKIQSVESIEELTSKKTTKKSKNINDDIIDDKKVELISDISNQSLIINNEVQEKIIENIVETNIDELFQKQTNEIGEETIDDVIISNNIEEIEINKEQNFNENIEEISHKILSNKELYESYIIDESPYKIYFRGNLLFNSINHSEKPIFLEDGFILFGKKYIYRGVRFEKY